MRSRVRVAVLTAALIGQGALAFPSQAAGHHPGIETVAEGLNNPRGIAVAADGTIYVAEAGEGGEQKCLTVGEGEEAFDVSVGATSTVTSISADGETVTTVIDELPSMMLGEGEYVGASDVTVAGDGSLYVSVGLGGQAGVRDEVAAECPSAALFGTVQHLSGGTLTQVTDLAQWEADNDPSADQPSTDGPDGGPDGEPSNDSNPNAVLATSDGGLFAADAGGNTVLEIAPDTGEVTLAAFLADRMVDAPPFLGAPPGTQIPMQAVPTSLTESPDGDVVLGQLTGFPFPVGGAHVYQVDDDATPTVIAQGFTNIMDVVYLDGELYVLEISHDSLLAGIGGALVRVRADGTRIALLRDVLIAPGGIAAGPDGMLYITQNSIGDPGTGSVLRFDPSLAADASIQSACPPLEVGGTTLVDIADTTHEEAITCTVWHGLFGGFADDTFRPAADITRGQLATTVARLVEAAGGDLPAGESGQFSDVDGTTHDDAINALAAAGIVDGFDDGTYRPHARVTRAQTVSILVAAYEHATDGDVPAGPDAFDDDGGVHEANINAAAAMEWIQGTAPRTFSPGENIRRGQMASVLARVASDLVDGEYLTLPQ